MSSKAISGVGTRFYRWNGSSDWVELSEINSFSFDGLSRDTIDVTDLKTAANNDGYRSIITGLRSSGTVSFNMNFTYDKYDEMKTDFESDNNQIYLLVLPDSRRTYMEFEGLITDLPLDVPMEDRINSDITVAVDGKVDIGSGAAQWGSSMPSAAPSASPSNW